MMLIKRHKSVKQKCPKQNGQSLCVWMAADRRLDPTLCVIVSASQIIFSFFLLFCPRLQAKVLLKKRERERKEEGEVLSFA